MNCPRRQSPDLEIATVDSSIILESTGLFYTNGTMHKTSAYGLCFLPFPFVLRFLGVSVVGAAWYDTERVHRPSRGTARSVYTDRVADSGAGITRDVVL